MTAPAAAPPVRWIGSRQKKQQHGKLTPGTEKKRAPGALGVHIKRPSVERGEFLDGIFASWSEGRMSTPRPPGSRWGVGGLGLSSFVVLLLLY